MPSDFTFGPSGREWQYSQSAKTYDLSYVSAKKLTIATSEGPPDTSITIAPESTALVIVDMQNFFLHPGCRDHPNGLAAVKPTIDTIKKCREVGIQVIWLNWGLTDEDMHTMPASVQRGFMRKTLLGTTTTPTGLGADMGEDRGRTLFAGSWNAEIYPPLAQYVLREDIQCAKNRMSGLWSPEQPLWRALQERGTKTVLFTGVNTDQCVLGTLTDAYNAGWDCVLVNDCCGTTTEGGKEVVVHNVASSYGFVINSTSLLAAKAG